MFIAIMFMDRQVQFDCLFLCLVYLLIYSVGKRGQENLTAETEANCSTYCFEADGPQKADPQCHRDRALLDCSLVINVSFANILSVSSEGNLLLPSPLSIKCNIKYKYCTSFLCSHHFH